MVIDGNLFGLLCWYKYFFIYKLIYNYTTFFNKSQGLATENYLGKLDFIYPKTGRDELLEVTLI